MGLFVSEEIPVGTLVGSIPTRPGFTYRFNQDQEQFSIDPRSGEIRTTARIDREATSDDQFDLIVLSSSPTYPIEVRSAFKNKNKKDLPLMHSQAISPYLALFFPLRPDRLKPISTFTHS